MKVHTLRVTLKDGRHENFTGNYRELSLLRARLLMAIEGEEVGIIRHRLTTETLNLRADDLASVGVVRAC